MKHYRLFQAVENEWEIQILRGERLRSGLILGVLLVFLTVNLLGHLLLPRMVQDLFAHRFPTFASFLGSGLFLLYEIGFFLALSWGIRTGRRLPRTAGYGNAFLETSIPTIAMTVSAYAFSPATALDSPFYLVYFLFIILSSIRMNVALALFTGGVAGVEYAALSLYFLPTGTGALALGFVRVTILVLAGVLTAVVASRVRSSVFHAWKSLDDKNRVVSLFGQHVSPAVVQKLLDQPQEVLSENLPVTVLFLDIRGFTSYAERRSPEQVVAYLNGLFDFMIDVVNRNHGIINKFLGDGFMAVFGAPLAEGNSARHALTAALELRGELSLRVKEGKTDPTRIGVGVHSGPALTGTVGSSQRKEYTVIGNVVNTASRLEALNKELGTTVLVSDEVWREGRWEGLAGRDRGEFLMRGKEDQLRVWEILEIDAT